MCVKSDSDIYIYIYLYKELIKYYLLTGRQEIDMND